MDNMRPHPSVRRRTQCALVLAPLLIGCVLRVWFAASWYRYFQPVLDPDEGYYESAIGLLAHHAYSTGIPSAIPRSWRGPIYPTFIAVVEGAFSSPNPGHIRLAEAVLSSFGIILVFALAQAAVSPFAGFIAAAWLALNPNQIALVSDLNIDGFYSVWILIVALATLLWIKRRGDDRSSIVLGGILAASLLCRSSHFLVAPLLAGAALFWWGWQRSTLRTIVLLAGTTVLGLAPMTVRNALQFGEFTLMADRNPGASVFFCAAMGLPSRYSCTIEHAIDLAVTIRPGFKRALPGYRGEEMYSQFFQLALQRIRTHPLPYARRCLWNLVDIWRTLWGYAVLACCAICLAPGKKEIQGLVLVAASFCGYALGAGTSGHMAAAVPILCAIGGCAVSLAARRVVAHAPAAMRRQRSPPRWFILGALAAAAALYAAMLVFIVGELHDWWWPRYSGNSEMSGTIPDAREQEVYRLGRFGYAGPASYWNDRALRQLRGASQDQAVAILSRAGRIGGSLDELKGVAHAMQQLHEYDLADAAFRMIVERTPRDSSARIALADLEHEAARSTDAATALRSAQSLALSPEILRLVALHYQDIGRPSEAFLILAALQKRWPSRPDIAVDAAVARYLSGDAEGAADALRAVISQSPGYAPAYFNLASILVGRRDYVGAEANCARGMSLYASRQTVPAAIRKMCAESERRAALRLR